jgi:ADP-ribose pyrophosphatase YjhB (NUDIX family)
MKPTLLGSEIVHANPWYKVRHDKLRWVNGQPGNYFVMDTANTAIVLAIKDENIMVVRQYRHTIDKFMLEFPGGSVQEGNSPLDAAKQELREEAGLEAERWTKLGEVQVMSGLSTMKMHVFLAGDFTNVPVEREASEESLEHQWMPIEKWNQSIKDGSSNDSESLAAWTLYLATQN